MNVQKRLLNFSTWIILFPCILLYSCEDKKPIPKPKAYPKVVFPERSTKIFNSENCPFAFKYPGYGVVNRDSTFFNKKIEEPCWFDLQFPGFNSTLHLTYKAIDESSSLLDLINDTRKMTYKHTQRADYINETPFRNEFDASGIIYEVGGDAASSYQFFITDRRSHFIRGSLYFKNVPNADSLNPVINFIKTDINELIQSFKWE